ncbi:MAG: hypothetical protein M1533_03185 [Candidatus Thermoplasmatota archaeon]|jgi:hypothetical protein|nr:hypothetical protein [Candidatus Thermoplasmatota archaeon]MCL5793807.1 hypothetical protein [Candidatus Thermoplasmatota archaeon]
MLVEDHRKVSCGGDPFNYLKSVLKGLSFQLDPGQDAQVLLDREKFSYSRDVFEGMGHLSKLKLMEIEEKPQEIDLVFRKENT